MSAVLDDLVVGGRLARDRDRPAAVSVGVFDRRGQRLTVPTETASETATETATTKAPAPEATATGATAAETWPAPEVAATAGDAGWRAAAEQPGHGSGSAAAEGAPGTTSTEGAG